MSFESKNDTLDKIYNNITFFNLNVEFPYKYTEEYGQSHITLLWI